ncbi:MAG: AI-2E family transporter [Caldilineaceae bacterium]
MYIPFLTPTQRNSILGFLLAAFLIVLVMINGSSILIPITISVGLWLIINDLTNAIHRVRIGPFQCPRGLAMIVGLVFITFVMLRVAGVVYFSAIDFMGRWPEYMTNLDALIATIPNRVWVALLGNEARRGVDVVEQLFLHGADYFNTYMTTLIASMASLFSNTIYVVVYVIFLLLEQETFSAKARNMFQDEAQRNEFQIIIHSIHEQIQTYITVKTIVSLITALVSFVAMFLFGLDYAMVWALLIFILNFIPNIGSVVAVMFPVLMALLQFGDWATVGALALALIIIQMINGYFIEPRMMGNQLNLSPFVVLVSLGVFGAIWGVTGMFLSVPLTVILMIVFSHFDSTRPLAVLLSGDGVVHGVQIDEPENAVVPISTQQQSTMS